MLPGRWAASPLPGVLAGGEGLGLAPPDSGGGCLRGLQRGQAKVKVGWWSVPGGHALVLLSLRGQHPYGYGHLWVLVLGVPPGEAASLCRELLAA